MVVDTTIWPHKDPEVYVTYHGPYATKAAAKGQVSSHTHNPRKTWDYNDPSYNWKIHSSAPEGQLTREIVVLTSKISWDEL